MTAYRLRIVGDGNSFVQNSVNCTIGCFYILNPTFQFSNYTVYLASINEDGDIGPENNVTIWSYQPSNETTGTCLSTFFFSFCTTHGDHNLIIPTQISEPCL